MIFVSPVYLKTKSAPLHSLPLMQRSLKLLNIWVKIVAQVQTVLRLNSALVLGILWARMFVMPFYFFFESLELPRIINSANVALVPKQHNPSLMTHFWPISSYNVLYNCISKLLVSRLQKILPTIISPFQSAFIPKRSIGDNMFLAQALCKDYHLGPLVVQSNWISIKHLILSIGTFYSLF